MSLETDSIAYHSDEDWLDIKTSRGPMYSIIYNIPRILTGETTITVSLFYNSLVYSLISA